MAWVVGLWFLVWVYAGALMQARSEQVSYFNEFMQARSEQVFVHGLGGGFIVFSLGLCRRVNAGAQ
jgi:hypothetical protein